MLGKVQVGDWEHDLVGHVELFGTVTTKASEYKERLKRTEERQKAAIRGGRVSKEILTP